MNIITISKYAVFTAFILSYSCLNMSAETIPSICEFSPSLSPTAQAILCAVESGLWRIPNNSSTILNAGCLLGSNRCAKVMHVPTKEEIPASAPPPEAKNKKYQELATTAEKVVPHIWWREGFSDDKLLLTKTNQEFPRKMFDIKPLSNKKLRNMYECVTRQQFIRKSLDFNVNTHTNSSSTKSTKVSSKAESTALKSCVAMSEPVVVKFYNLWKNAKHLNGIFKPTTMPGKSDIVSLWYPDPADKGDLLVAAHEVLEYFYATHGGIWTGCFAFEESADCRGAIAAASMVVASYFIADIAGRGKSFSESQFVRGYILASLARHVLHGDTGRVGDKTITTWAVKLYDCIAIQSAFLKLYIDSFGELYKKQVDQYIPVAFQPDFTTHAKPRWHHIAASLEPVYSSIRNWMYFESSNLIDFGPYRPLVAYEEVRSHLLSTKCRRVLIDVGANGFFASPKYLIDSYAPYLPFTDVIMVEPEPHFSATVPKSYSDRYKINFQQIYAEVATGSETDMLKLLPTLVTKDDFVVLKFDVDPNRYAYGPTMEWGFLFEIMQNSQIAELIDEVYIELHFHFPILYWKHYHSNWEALDTFRKLRRDGAIVHSWP